MRLLVEDHVRVYRGQTVHGKLQKRYNKWGWSDGEWLRPCRLCVPASQLSRHFLAGSRAEHIVAADRAAHHALLLRTTQRLRASLRCCSVCEPCAALDARRSWKKRRPQGLYLAGHEAADLGSGDPLRDGASVSTTSLRTAPAAAAAADPATTLLPTTLPRCHPVTCRHITYITNSARLLNPSSIRPNSSPEGCLVSQVVFTHIPTSFGSKRDVTSRSRRGGAISW